MSNHCISPILRRFGTWAVTTYGVECLTRGYPIDRAWLDEPDWMDHMREKSWVVMSDFRAAFSAGRELHRRKQSSKVRVPKTKTGSVRLVPLRARFAILKRDGFRCQLCGATPGDGARLEVDHRVPKAKGGSDDPSNLWALCFDCNRGKGTEDV